MCVHPAHINCILKINEPLHKPIKTQKKNTFKYVLRPSETKDPEIAIYWQFLASETASFWRFLDPESE